MDRGPERREKKFRGTRQRTLGGLLMTEIERILTDPSRLRVPVNRFLRETLS